MFDLAWSEIALIGVVALIAIGPKDLPVAIKAVTNMLKKGRRMASEFQGHVDEMVRDADLHEVRDQINELRNIDVKGRILNTVDADGSLRRAVDDPAFKQDFFSSRQGDVSPATAPATATDTETAMVPEAAPPDALPPADAPPEPPPPAAPAFIPPDAVAERLPARP